MFRMTSFLVSAERHKQIQLIREIISFLYWQNPGILKFIFCLPSRIHSTRGKRYISEFIWPIAMDFSEREMETARSSNSGQKI